MVTYIWVKIGSGNGLLPEDSKPLPEPPISDILWDSPESNFTALDQATVLYNENHIF